MGQAKIFDCSTGQTTIVDVADPVPTIDQVAAERDRRLAAGFHYNFGDSRGTHLIGTTPDDMTKWREVTDAANAAINLNQGSTTIAIVTNTGPCTVTATEWQSILMAAFTFRQPFYAASFTLEATNPIPANYADDSHWPAAG